VPCLDRRPVTIIRRVSASYTAIEALLATLVALLTAYELRGIIAARLAGRSRNISRLVTHLLMIVLLVPWVGYTYYWSSIVSRPNVSSDDFGSGALNLPYQLLGVGLLLLAAFEILMLYRARRQGYTQNVSRLVSHALVAALVVAMVALSVREWNAFVAGAAAVDASASVGSP